MRERGGPGALDRHLAKLWRPDRRMTDGWTDGQIEKGAVSVEQGPGRSLLRGGRE